MFFLLENKNLNNPSLIYFEIKLSWKCIKSFRLVFFLCYLMKVQFQHKI